MSFVQRILKCLHNRFLYATCAILTAHTVWHLEGGAHHASQLMLYGLLALCWSSLFYGFARRLLGIWALAALYLLVTNFIYTCNMAIETKEAQESGNTEVMVEVMGQTLTKSLEELFKELGRVMRELPW